MKASKVRLRWKKDPPERGLARVASGPRGSKLRTPDGRVAATVSSLCVRIGVYRGWYWVAGWDHRDRVPSRNTHAEPVKTEAEAKEQAEKYVREFLQVREGIE